MFIKINTNFRNMLEIITLTSDHNQRQSKQPTTKLESLYEKVIF